MLCIECGAVIAPGPLDLRHANRGDATVECPPAFLRRLCRLFVAIRSAPKPKSDGEFRHDPRI